MPKETLSGLLPPSLAEPDLLARIQRRKRYKAVGSFGAISSLVLFLATKLLPQFGGALSTVLLTVLVASVTLIGLTRLWFRESEEPFRYTYSVGGFDFVAGDVRALGPALAGEEDPIEWLTRDLAEKLAQRVPRLSLREAPGDSGADEDDESGSHVHITGWYGFRRDDGWTLEVVPKVRLGGAGAPAKLAGAVHFKLGSAKPGAAVDRPAPLSEEGYQMLFERVYWSVASQIYRQIRRGVEEKVNLLPGKALRASAFIHEADDYATSNTLEAYAAARKLYRQALEIYEIGVRIPPATPWRERMTRLMEWIDRRRRGFRRWRAGFWRRPGRREVMTARAEIGLARMLVAEWHLRQLCGMVPREIYVGVGYVERAIGRLEAVPSDVPDQPRTLFRAHITLATIRLFLRDRPGAREALAEVVRLFPEQAHGDADFLFAAGMIETDQLLSLRLLGQAVELEPTMERALFHRAERCNDIWRRRDEFEPEVAESVDAEYRAVIGLNPGNLAAWAQRGYIGWILAEEGRSAEERNWRRKAIDALEAGRQYKEVRKEATVAELDWTLARLAAEEGNFAEAYEQYIQAVSAKLGAAPVEFESDYYLSATEALVERYHRYQRRVVEKAATAEEAATAGREGKVSVRLVRSVKAFVLNDCGLAYQAHYDRSGREQDLVDAKLAFEEARKVNRAFVLPTFNLAKLHRQLAETPGSSDKEVASDRHRAAMLLKEVLGHEPDWAPAQLLMIEVQADLAADLERQLEQAKEGSPGALPAAAGSPGITVATGARVSQLAARRDRCHVHAELHLRRLLPHKKLHLDGGEVHRVDAQGTHVRSLLDDPTVRWTEDFNSVHVAAFVQWGKVLATTSPAAANRICRRLRRSYYRADVDLLHAHLKAATLLAGNDTDGGGKVALVAEECEGLLQELIRMELRRDPTHLGSLKQTPLLPADERRAVLKSASKENPSATALIWVGDAQLALDDVDDAVKTYKRARADGRDSIARAASLRLAKQLERREGAAREAIEAYRAAGRSSDAPVAAEALAGAGRLLYAMENEVEARSAYRQAASRPPVAPPLGLRLEKEGRTEDAIQLYREAFANAGSEGEVAAEIRFRLALALVEANEDEQPEAERHLREVAATGFAVAWRAALALARLLPDDQSEEAEELFRRVLEQSDPAAKIEATWRFGEFLEAKGEADRARELYLEQSRASPRVATWIAKLKEARGDDDAEGFPDQVADKAAVEA